MNLWLFIGLLLFSAGSMTGSVWLVGPDWALKNVSDALLLAQSGDTIQVQSGLYQEGTIDIKKHVVLLGIDWPVLDGQAKSTVISVSADSVTISGFRIENSGYSSLEEPAGIKLINCRGVHVTGNRVSKSFFGVYLQYAKQCVIQNNYITGSPDQRGQNGNGIHCWYSDSLLIVGNVVEGHRDGIYFEFVTNTMIWRNISRSNIRYGLHFMFSNDDAYIGNVFRDNGAGVAVMFSKRVTMIANFFQENWGDAAYGLLLKEISDSYIEGNEFQKNTVAIFMEGTNRVKVERNFFYRNGWGMKIQASCLDNNIVNNAFVANTFDVSTNGSLVQNTFAKNYWDRYQGYDLDKDGYGDVPFRPLSLFAVLVERCPSAMLLYRSFVVVALDKAERFLPTLTPESFMDNSPRLRHHPS